MPYKNKQVYNAYKKYWRRKNKAIANRMFVPTWDFKNVNSLIEE